MIGKQKFVTKKLALLTKLVMENSRTLPETTSVQLKTILVFGRYEVAHLHQYPTRALIVRSLYVNTSNFYIKSTQIKQPYNTYKSNNCSASVLCSGLISIDRFFY